MLVPGVIDVKRLSAADKLKVVLAEEAFAPGWSISPSKQLTRSVKVDELWQQVESCGSSSKQAVPQTALLQSSSEASEPQSCVTRSRQVSFACRAVKRGAERSSKEVLWAMSEKMKRA